VYTGEAPSDSVRMAPGAGCCATDAQPLYHLVQAPLWQQCKDEGKAYYPPTYEQVRGPCLNPPFVKLSVDLSWMLIWVYIRMCCHHGLQDGFTHATAEARLLLGVANHFYKGKKSSHEGPPHLNWSRKRFL
jgi:hypothetical protein